MLDIRDLIYLMKLTHHLDKIEDRDVFQMVDKIQLLMSSKNIDSGLFTQSIASFLERTPNLTELELQLYNNSIDD